MKVFGLNIEEANLELVSDHYQLIGIGVVPREAAEMVGVLECHVSVRVAHLHFEQIEDSVNEGVVAALRIAIFVFLFVLLRLGLADFLEGAGEPGGIPHGHRANTLVLHPLKQEWLSVHICISFAELFWFVE